MVVIISLLGVSIIIASIAYSRKKVESSGLRFLIIAAAFVVAVLGAGYLGGQFAGAEGATNAVVYMIWITIGYSILKAIFFRKAKKKDTA